MIDDIVTRLRGWVDRMDPSLLVLTEAADEIERLRADLLSTRLAHIATIGELMEVVTNDDPLRKVEKH